MEFTKDIYFDSDLKAGKESKITYSGNLFQNGSNNVNIVYGFGEAWNNTTTKPMEKTDNGFVANVRMRNFDTFNFCFSDENNNWDNNNYCNYISPILPEEAETEVDFGKDYSASIDDIIEDILGNTTKQDIIANKDNDSIDKILQSINEVALPEIEALFNDLFFESVKEDEKENNKTYEISMEPELAKELKEVEEAVENKNYTPIEEVDPNENAELIRLFNELFETSEKPMEFEVENETKEDVVATTEEPKLNVSAFNLDGLVSDILEPVISSQISNNAEENSLFEDMQEDENNEETSLTLLDSKEFTVASRKLGYFYKLRKRIRLALLKLAKIPKDFVKQLGL